MGSARHVYYRAINRSAPLNVACSFCDTEFESYKNLLLIDVISKVRVLSDDGNIKLVVITGGEPFRQNIVKLCDELLANGFKVQIETNGTLYQPINEMVDVVCSPKNVNGFYCNIRPDLLKHISAFKFLVSAFNSNYQQIPEIGQSQYSADIYIQPIDEQDDEKNQINQSFAIKLALEKNLSL